MRSDSEKVLYREHPRMFRANPAGFVSCLVFSVIGIGLIVWWIKCLGATLIVTNERTTLRGGILAKRTTDVWHRDVRNVSVDQTFTNRLFNVGTVGISSAGQSNVEVALAGLPSPERIKQLIDEHRRRGS